MATDPEFLTAEEYGELVRVGVRTVLRAASAGEIDGAFKVGRQWRIPNPLIGKSQKAS